MDRYLEEELWLKAPFSAAMQTLTIPCSALCVQTTPAKNNKEPNQLILYGGLENGGIFKMDLNTGDNHGKYLGQRGPISCLSICNGYLASACFDSTIFIWELNTMICVTTLSGHQSSVTTIQLFSRESENLDHPNSLNSLLAVSSSLDGEIICWKLSTEAPAIRFQANSDKVLCVKVDLKNHLLFVGGGKNGLIKIWNFHFPEHSDEIKGLKGELTGHQEVVSCLDLSEDGFLISGSYDRQIRIWDWKSSQCLQILAGKHASPIYEVKIYHSLAFTISHEGKLMIWNWRLKPANSTNLEPVTKITRSLQIKGSKISCGCIFPEGKLIVAGSFNSSSLIRWSLEKTKD